MAAKAFILIETAAGRTKEIASSLKQIEGVKSVDTVTGPYDIIAVIERESLTEIGDLVTGDIYSVAGFQDSYLPVLLVFTERPSFTIEA